jgi:hypothetical protein
MCRILYSVLVIVSQFFRGPDRGGMQRGAGLGAARFWRYIEKSRRLSEGQKIGFSTAWDGRKWLRMLPKIVAGTGHPTACPFYRPLENVNRMMKKLMPEKRLTSVFFYLRNGTSQYLSDQVAFPMSARQRKMGHASEKQTRNYEAVQSKIGPEHDFSSEVIHDLKLPCSPLFLGHNGLRVCFG